jgi:hypothetical protein
MVMANPNGNPQNLIPFRPGQSGNPGGKPLLARNRLSARFLGELASDFDQHGRAAIVACREQSPERYLAIVASLLPKELKLERDPALADYSDNELQGMLELLRDRLDSLEQSAATAVYDATDEAL